MYVDVILRNKSKYADMLFTYRIPPELEEEIKRGHRISVPFGRSDKPIEAFAITVKENLEKDSISPEKIKYISDILDENPMLSEENIRLIFWMRNRYMCTYDDCINLFYPKGYSLKSKKVITFGNNEEIYSDNSKEKKILDYVVENNGKVDYIDVVNLFGKKAIDDMKSNDSIKVIWEYQERKNEKKIKYIKLNDTEEIIKDKILENKYRIGISQKKLLEFLYLNEQVEFQTAISLLNIYSSTIKSLESKGLIKVEEIDYYRRVDSSIEVEQKEISLNDEQKFIFESIIDSDLDLNKKPHLIHGITGSGKTEIYLELIKNKLEQGLESILLVPEIALTPQMISRVKNRFGNMVGVFHSMLSEGEKHDVYREVKNGNIRIVIGTRSALYLPFDSLGLVIIDEEHDLSYKSDMTPKYDTIEVARFMALKQNVTVVLGSATPSVSDYYKALNGEYILHKLIKRANKKSLPDIEIVDMRLELHSGNSSELSNKLLDSIEKTVESNNQVILFLNRRGYSNFVTCKDCGHVFTCERCDISLTYHKNIKKGICHYCGLEENIPNNCPICNGINIGSLGIGTEKIEEMIKKKFPKYRVMRVDKDTTSKKGQLEDILRKFNSQEVDILIGTQILSKGHDFDNVTLVGIISADMMLNYPDFRSYESTFQLITQVSGRSGRSEKEGKVILQTYDTEHFAIKRAANHDYEGFYKDEIKLRELFGYEPFNSIFRVVFSHKNYDLAKNNAYKFYETLKFLFESKDLDISGHILGPNECSINKIKEKYRWQVIIKNRNIDIKILKAMIKYISVTKRDDIFDNGVLINVELNPRSFI
ncbi:primosomal protein N' [Peptostreptococcus faecalis]|uniref:primosomal protein N' n=1 Tax=Peptostreptococcus faecalis TaxID=2045015 RepID=UPI000C799CC5|nr:primosomal protein N' [Peptostreptococcus faecalis]